MESGPTRQAVLNVSRIGKWDTERNRASEAIAILLMLRCDLMVKSLCCTTRGAALLYTRGVILSSHSPKALPQACHVVQTETSSLDAGTTWSHSSRRGVPTPGCRAVVENLSIRALTRSPRVLARNNKQSQLEEITDLVESIPDFRGRNWFILQDVAQTCFKGEWSDPER